MKKVLVVDDSLTIRKAISEIIDEQADFTVVGEACDGQQAWEMTQRLSPDVITMDMMMPVMNGLEATRAIMANQPTPILVVSASTNRGELMKTYDALAAGAVSVVEKPGGRALDDDSWERHLLAELRLVVKIPVVRHLDGSTKMKQFSNSMSQTNKPQVSTDGRFSGLQKKPFTHVVIGGSTGAPGALNTLLKALPANFPIPICCVVHISEAFSTSLAEWLDRNTQLKVITPTDGMQYGRPGHVFLAPSGVHLLMKETYLKHSTEAPQNFCRPSVDVLFESAAKIHHGGVIGVVLTGMGNDGAIGLRSIKAAGGYAITQSEATCTVYGMPQQADILCEVDQHLSPLEIAEHLVALVC